MEHNYLFLVNYPFNIIFYFLLNDTLNKKQN